MLNNSTEKLFGGINKIIAEKYTKMYIQEAKSVSDIEQKPENGETQLDEKDCKEKKGESIPEPIQESQDYHTFLKRDEFDNKLKSLGLSAEHNGKDHDEVKDSSGDLKGWWNDHTGVGYLRKDCCHPVNENTYEPGQQEPQTHTEPGDFTTDEALKIAIQTAANRAKESGTHYHDEIIKELGAHGLDPFRSSTHNKLDKVTVDMTNGAYQHHSDYGMDHVTGQLKEDMNLETPVVESILIPTDKLEESPIISRGGNESGVIVKEEDEKKLEEAHLTPELTDKIEQYIHKLKPKMSEFKDKYGDDAESVMYGTATKLAKNDLGIKD